MTKTFHYNLSNWKHLFLWWGLSLFICCLSSNEALSIPSIEKTKIEHSFSLPKFIPNTNSNSHYSTTSIFNKINVLENGINTIDLTLCERESILVNNTVYDLNNPSGQEIIPNGGSSGCDSIITINLSFYPPAYSSFDQEICTDDSYIINGTTYDINNPTGTEVLTAASVNGCDSMIIINLFPTPLAASSINEVLCSGNSLTINNTVYDEENPSGVETLFGAATNGCDSIINIALSFEPIIEASLTGTNSICNGAEGTLTFSLTGAASYDLTYSDGINPSITLNGISDGYSVPISPSNNTTYSIETVNPNALCPAQIGTPFNVTVADIKGDAIAATDYGDFNISCPNASDGAVTLTGLVGVAPFRYEWTNGSTAATVANLPAGEYEVTITDAIECSTTTKVTLSEPPNLSYQLATDFSGCTRPSGAALIENLAGGNSEYEYSLDGVNFEATNGTSIALSELDAGSYTIYLQDVNDCQEEIDFYIGQYQARPFELGENQIIAEGETVTLMPSSIITSNSTMEWYSNGILSCDSCELLEVAPIMSTTYSLTITDERQCTHTDSITILVERQESVFVPDAFSPNNDGKNDSWTIYAGATITQIQQLQIFDRWGVLVHSRNNILLNEELEGWNGQFKGKSLPTGVYVFWAELLLSDGTIKKLSGDITLVR